MRFAAFLIAIAMVMTPQVTLGRGAGVPVGRYLEGSDAVLVAEVISSENVQLDGVGCGQRTRVRTVETLKGQSAIDEIGTELWLYSEKRYLFFLREGKGAFPPSDYLVDPDSDEGKKLQLCAQGLPDYSANYRVVGEFVRLRDGIEDDYAGIDLVSVYWFVQLPEFLVKKKRKYEIADFAAGPSDAAREIGRYFPTWWYFWQGDVVPWSDYRDYLVNEIDRQNLK